MSATALVYDPRFLEHDAGPGHPECPSRLTSIMERLDRDRLLAVPSLTR